MKSAFLVLISLTFGLALAEGVLRLKNSSMRSYEIEMWRYARLLKVPSADPVLGHEHVPSRCATLQGVEVCTNEWGLRGPSVGAPQPGKRRILFLGASVTLGWGTAEPDTVTSRVAKMFRDAGQDVEVLNAGIGNYNSVRYVELFLTKLAPLSPTDIVVQYFLRDAETLERGEGNWALRHSQLAVTVWNVWHQWMSAARGGTLDDHYRKVYEPGAPGFVAMKEALTKLSAYAHEHHIHLVLAMTPDLHDLVHYPFAYIHETMKGVAGELGYEYVDTFTALSGLTPDRVWSLPGDPHPNGLGHLKMAEAIFPVLAPGAARGTAGK